MLSRLGYCFRDLLFHVVQNLESRKSQNTYLIYLCFKEVIVIQNCDYRLLLKAGCLEDLSVDAPEYSMLHYSKRQMGIIIFI